MPAFAWEDLDDFLDTDEFAVEAVLALQAGGTLTVTGIFDDPYLNAELGEYELDTSRPRMTCKAADVSNATRGDTLTIGNETYDVMSGPQNDSTGMAVLELARRHQ